MRHVLFAGLVLVAVAAFCWGVSGCATKPPEPVIQTVEVKIPVPVPCPDKRPAPAVYPDTAAAIGSVPAGDILGLAKLYAEANVLMHERLGEDDAQIKACALAGTPSP
jgi:hypothetical protein